ncbi:hypothetical protein BAUCODRAFT_30104 [Baudoinia panamericana UAMH 10762]|uniref:Alkaline phosphatase n=1 Tax=Baudoinia panamericana (strain UAMH 10762) TaxID=717646 RepID=M2NJX0_BAUPA|nr:uncharacterized protein BAUCODRAFT_30104 [Baudoinia panamericana UAMH 10762]EMC99724.1 hypothetical protein BAUCODRAFT_30104 [Baudoinia panamericana UAMH 10762]
MAARGQEPLIAQQTPSEGAEDDRIEEEDALLTGQPAHKQASTTAFVKKRWHEVGLFLWALLATVAVVVLAVVYQNTKDVAGGDSPNTAAPSGKRNLIFMVSDGMGPTSLTLTREWRQFSEQLPYDETLILDQHLIGQSRTRSTSSLVTDSAAGATAFSCGRKSYNGAISVLPDHSPCGSVMEAAKRMGYTTGLVVTTRITDATPAVFVSHVRRREMEDSIAMQMVGETHPLGRMVDLMFGGGRCHFLPSSANGSCRKDDIDVIQLAQDKGWGYISNREDFDNLGTSVELPMLGLFADTDFPYEIDRRYQDDVYPSLEEMTRTALDALSAASADKDQGFFVMIEGSRIDHAGHANDPAAQVHEVQAYDRAMAAVLDFVRDAETPTLMVSTSDHETGGLATARQLHAAYPDYLWYPGVLANASHSASYLDHEYHQHLHAKPTPTGDETVAYIAALVSETLGIHDLGQDEIENLVQDPATAAYQFADMVSRRAQTGWTTHGHSGADVNIYSSDPSAADKLVGNHENTEVGDFLRYYLGLNEEVERVTNELREHMKITGSSWLGEVPGAGERLDGQDHIEHYTGDHKKRSVCDVGGH